jgi:hypothetical protein
MARTSAGSTSSRVAPQRWICKPEAERSVYSANCALDQFVQRFCLRANGRHRARRHRHQWLAPSPGCSIISGQPRSTPRRSRRRRCVQCQRMFGRHRPPDADDKLVVTQLSKGGGVRHGHLADHAGSVLLHSEKLQLTNPLWVDSGFGSRQARGAGTTTTRTFADPDRIDAVLSSPGGASTGAVEVRGVGQRPAGPAPSRVQRTEPSKYRRLTCRCACKG